MLIWIGLKTDFSKAKGSIGARTLSQLEIDYQRQVCTKYSMVGGQYALGMGVLNGILKQTKTGSEATTTRAISGSGTSGTGGNYQIASKARNLHNNQSCGGFFIPTFFLSQRRLGPEASNKLKTPNVKPSGDI